MNRKEKKPNIPQEAIDFYYSDDARGIRLQVDYEKAESKIKEHGIEHTIVVFGSARTKPSDMAVKELKKIEEILQGSIEEKELQKNSLLQKKF